jgi:hypothetical protein
MSDLTMDRYYEERFHWRNKKEPWKIDTSADRVIYKGMPLIIDQDVDTANVVQFDSNVTLAAGDIFVGFALEHKEVDSGDDEDTEVLVFMSGEFGLAASGISDADAGKQIYLSDSQVLTLTAGTNLEVGRVARVSGGVIYIEVNPNGTPIIQ